MELQELKTLMFKQGITYRVAAKAVGMGTNTLSNKLNGKSSFNSEEIEELVEYLNIDPKDINVYFFPRMLHFVTKDRD